jgi:cell shape-determining protein MreD
VVIGFHRYGVLQDLAVMGVFGVAMLVFAVRGFESRD